MELPVTAASWLLPAVLPIALYVAYSDMSRLKIPNKAVLALLAVYAVLGLITLPLPVYLWQWSHLVVMLLVGMLLNAGGVIGAGDAKFIAASAPMVFMGDILLILVLLTASLLAGFATHRIAKYTGGQRLVPQWKSWNSGSKYPMGLSLGMTVLAYLGLGTVFGSS